MKVRGKTVIYILHKYILGYFGKQQKATDEINNRFLKTTDKKKDFKNNRLKEQQVSTTSYFQKQQIPRSNRFQKTTDSKKKQISKSTD